MLKFRSVISIVRAAARTGKENASRKEVINTDHTNKGTLDHCMPGVFILMMVVMKLIAPKIEDTPAMWSLKIPMSTHEEPWKTKFDRGGYTVHPVPTPISIVEERIIKEREGGSSQNLILFSRG